jgi:hypothetical protein
MEAAPSITARFACCRLVDGAHVRSAFSATSGKFSLDRTERQGRKKRAHAKEHNHYESKDSAQGSVRVQQGSGCRQDHRVAALCRLRKRPHHHRRHQDSRASVSDTLADKG